MIERVLVANRGEIAQRIFRTCRDLGIATVAVFSDPDADLPFVAEADVAVRLPGAAPAETYLRADSLIAAALQAGADAVHPGYGFLSEDAGFARAVTAAGLTWIGPPAQAIAAMGSKLEAKQLMSAAGVPVLPGGPVTDTDALVVAETIGYPVLVKASAGGGGRGMRVVHDAGELTAAVHSARREAGAAFGDDTVFLERYLERARHIEVQIVADAHGGVVALFERDCSVQRRHQKVIEEAPSPVVDDALRARLCEAAVLAARAVDYRGVGTVEFVVSAEGEPAFLEMNTRLQVEHPVTELVTGLDLVAVQLALADGHPLPEEVRTACLGGHAIEARLYAEDVPAGFLPATGTLSTFELPATRGLRVDSGVASGSTVGVHYDALLAKVIAHAPTRAEALRLLAAGLARARVHGVRTNRDLLVRILRSPEFSTAGVDTGWLERQDPALVGAALLDQQGVIVSAVAAALAGAARRRQQARVQQSLPAGWRNVASAPARTSYALGSGTIVVEHDHRGGVWVDGVALLVLALRCSPEEVVLETEGSRRSFTVTREGEQVWVDSSLGSLSLRELDPLPVPGAGPADGALVAPMPGTVLSIGCTVGDAVQAGQVLVVLEAMKMEHSVRSPQAGTVSVVGVVAGQQVDAGWVLVQLA